MSKFDEIEDDYAAVAYLLDPKQNSGLVVEVLVEYVRERQAGREPKLAAWNALIEWDC